MRATLEPSIRAMGKDHPRVGLIRQNIAGILNQLGRDEAAAEEYEQALAIRIRALGVGHEKVAMTRSNYAMTLLELGRYEDAREQAAEAWRVRKDANLRPDQKASTASVLARATYLADPSSASEARELAKLARAHYERNGDHASDVKEMDDFIAGLPR